MIMNQAYRAGPQHYKYFHETDLIFSETLFFRQYSKNVTNTGFTLSHTRGYYNDRTINDTHATGISLFRFIQMERLEMAGST